MSTRHIDIVFGAWIPITSLSSLDGRKYDLSNIRKTIEKLGLRVPDDVPKELEIKDEDAFYYKKLKIPGTEYKIIIFDGVQMMCYIQLKKIFIEIFQNVAEIKPPSSKEVKAFKRFLEKHQIPYKYSMHLIDN